MSERLPERVTPAPTVTRDLIRRGDYVRIEPVGGSAASGVYIEVVYADTYGIAGYVDTYTAFLLSDRPAVEDDDITLWPWSSIASVTVINGGAA